MTVAALKVEDAVSTLYSRLLSARQGVSVEKNLARMLSSYSFAQGVMPKFLGLRAFEFNAMMQQHFPYFDKSTLCHPQKFLDTQRLDEAQDLHRLLMQSLTGKHYSERLMVDILVAGCQGSDHLWQDLGLWQRADLSQLMHENFQPLAVQNTKDMKWKKFLYKQLCEAEGIYVCRAPSCECCTDYANCFATEE